MIPLFVVMTEMMPLIFFFRGSIVTLLATIAGANLGVAALASLAGISAFRRPPKR